LQVSAHLLQLLLELLILCGRVHAGTTAGPIERALCLSCLLVSVALFDVALLLPLQRTKTT
jgi:hypothetical protein